MPPITKDSDAVTAPETTARSGSASPTSTESAVKAQPVALEIPITVNGVRTAEGSDKREPFSESTKTVMVHGSGAVIKLTSTMAPGQLVFLTNDRTKKEVVCQVVKSKNYRNVSGYVELEFTEAAVGFWGMRFPGDRIGPGPQAAPVETRKPAAGNGTPAAGPVAARPAAPAASSAPSANGNGAKPAAPAPSASAPSVAKPAAPRPSATTSSSSVPAPMDSAALLGASKAKPNASVPAAPAPIATSLGVDTPLVEPWLKKREPAPRVPAAPPVKPPEPDLSLTPARNFGVERPSEKHASLFAPAEAPANLASVDLSSIAPFFEVKPVVADEPVAPQKPTAVSDSETEELKQQTARLQDELAKMQFAKEPAALTENVEDEEAEAEKAEAAVVAEKPALPGMEVSFFPMTEQSLETLKAELVHENAVRLMENPEPANAAPVLPEPSRLDEPVRFEDPAPLKAEPPAVIPALESLEQEEMKIPAWLAPLARNTSAPSSTQELVLREKTKRRTEQPQLQELVAPLVAPAEDRGASQARVPQFGSALPFEDSRSAGKSSPKKSGKGMLLGGITAGILALVGGGWWYMNQQAAGNRSVASAGSSAGAGSAELQTSAMKESVLGTTSRQADATASRAKAAGVDSNGPNNAAGNVSSSVPPGSAAGASRGSQVSESVSNGGNVPTRAGSAEPDPVQAVEVEKKPALGEVHLAAPKIAQKRTVQAGAAPDAGVLSEDQPTESGDSLGGLAVAGSQPAAPAAPVAIGGDVKQAKLISSVAPIYPAMAKTQRISGAVTIDALIDANGRVTTMKVVSGPALLQEAAKDALKQWKYEPAMLDGKAVPMHLTVTLQFRTQQ